MRFDYNLLCVSAFYCDSRIEYPRSRLRAAPRGGALYLDFQTVKISKRTGAISMVRGRWIGGIGGASGWPESVEMEVPALRSAHAASDLNPTQPHPTLPYPTRQLGVDPTRVPAALGLTREQLVTAAAYLGTDFRSRDEYTIGRARALYGTECAVRAVAAFVREGKFEADTLRIKDAVEWYGVATDLDPAVRTRGQAPPRYSGLVWVRAISVS